MQEQGKIERKVRRVRIADRDALRRVLEGVEDVEGSQRRAAKRLGLTRRTYGRLRHDEREFMSAATYLTLRDALDGHQIEFGLIDLLDGAVARDPFVGPNYEYWVRQELARLRPGAQPIYEELVTHKQYRRRFENFWERTTPGPEVEAYSEERIWLGIYRALEPLCASGSTWGVERSWREMHERDELKPFLKAALKAERLILRRDRDLERFASREAPEEFMASLAPGEGEDRGRDVPASFWDDVLGPE